MSRRKTVKLNLEFVTAKIKAVCRSNVVFCEMMGREKQKTWVSDWCRTPAKNLPSPEEAAQMCAILQVEPEDILVEQDDIELVRSLIQEQKKPAPTNGNGLEDELMQLFRRLSPAEQERELAYLRSRAGAGDK